MTANPDLSQGVSALVNRAMKLEALAERLASDLETASALLAANGCQTSAKLYAKNAERARAVLNPETHKAMSK